MTVLRAYLLYYINTFSKLNTEASGCPVWCKSREDEDRYIVNFLAHEGIILDKDLILKKIPGYRAMAKLLLNSLRGRLGMRGDKTKKQFINDSDSLVKIITNDAYDVGRLYELDEESLVVSYKNKSESQLVQKSVNVVLAVYTTALACLHLYGYLDKLKENCLYYDSDSVIYIFKNDQTPLPVIT